MKCTTAPQHLISKVCHGFLSGASDCGIYRRGLLVGLQICGDLVGLWFGCRWQLHPKKGSNLKWKGILSFVDKIQEFGKPVKSWCKARLKSCFGVSGWWSFWRLWSDHDHRRSWDLGSCDFDVKHVDHLAGLRWCWWVGTLTKVFFFCSFFWGLWLGCLLKILLIGSDSSRESQSCLNFWTLNVDPQRWQLWVICPWPSSARVAMCFLCSEAQSLMLVFHFLAVPDFSWTRSKSANEMHVFFKGRGECHKKLWKNTIWCLEAGEAGRLRDLTGVQDRTTHVRFWELMRDIKTGGRSRREGQKATKTAKKSHVFQSEFESNLRIARRQASHRKEEDRRQVALDKAVTKLDLKFATWFFLEHWSVKQSFWGPCWVCVVLLYLHRPPSRSPCCSFSFCVLQNKQPAQPRKTLTEKNKGPAKKSKRAKAWNPWNANGSWFANSLGAFQGSKGKKGQTLSANWGSIWDMIVLNDLVTSR